jgi:hypothetical protein
MPRSNTYRARFDLRPPYFDTGFLGLLVAYLSRMKGAIVRDFDKLRLCPVQVLEEPSVLNCTMNMAACNLLLPFSESLPCFIEPFKVYYSIHSFDFARAILKPDNLQTSRSWAGDGGRHRKDWSVT